MANEFLTMGSQMDDALAIPVLGFPVIFDPQAQTLRLLRSIDFPVRELIIVAMGDKKHKYMDILMARAQEIRPDARIIRVASNLGCAGAWNEILHTTPDAPWWLIGSNDVAYQPGMLERIASNTRRALKAEALGGPFAPGLRTFAIKGQPEEANTLPSFVLSRRAVAIVGLFDENFWPAYAEDNDYFNRIKLMGGAKVGVASFHDNTVEIIHGPEDWEDGRHYSGLNDGPIMTWEADDIAQIMISSNNFRLHFCQKYGPLGRVGKCRDVQYSSVGPFGVFTASWDDWVLDPVRRACSQARGLLCAYDPTLLEQQQKKKKK